MFKAKTKTPNLLTNRQLAYKLQGGRVKVGYRAHYAVYVHENMEMRLRGRKRKSGNGVYWGALSGMGSCKFLEWPAQRMANDKTIVNKIGGFLKRTWNTATGNSKKGLQEAGEELLIESQKLVPVDDGALWLSGYVEVE